MFDIFALLLPQIQILFSLSINEYINTGKRTLDTCLIAIAGIIFTSMMTYIPKLYELLFKFSIFKINDKIPFDPEKIDKSLLTNSAISEYKYNFTLNTYS